MNKNVAGQVVVLLAVVYNWFQAFVKPLRRLRAFGHRLNVEFGASDQNENAKGHPTVQSVQHGDLRTDDLPFADSLQQKSRKHSSPMPCMNESKAIRNRC